MRGTIEKPVRSRGVLPLTGMEEWFEGIRKPFSLLPWQALAPFRFGETDFVGPAVDMFEESGNLVVHAELPGLTRADVEVTVDNDLITITGEKKEETKVERDDYYRAECVFGTFTRRLLMPEGVNPDKVDATFKDGVLTIIVPKVEIVETKGRKIKIH